VRNATAWGNAPGKLPTDPEALKARHEAVACCTPVLIPRLQRFDHNSTVNLGRWPRLLHHAPLALNTSKNLIDESSMSLPLGGVWGGRTTRSFFVYVGSVKFALSLQTKLPTHHFSPPTIL
jgi:hypothetical protein